MKFFFFIIIIILFNLRQMFTRTPSRRQFQLRNPSAREIILCTHTQY